MSIDLQADVLFFYVQCGVQESDIFRRYKGSIARDMERPDATDSEIWEYVSRLPSYTNKQGIPKTSRWFSWNEQARCQLKEFHASRMIMEFYVGDNDLQPDQMVMTKRTLKEGGGLKLYYLCHKTLYNECAWVAYISQQPCWTWYTDQLDRVKTPEHNVIETMASVQEDGPQFWKADAHLKSLATLIGSNNVETWFQLWETSTDSEELAKMIWNYVALLLTNRAGSLAKFGSPPECWALALSELHGQRQAAVTQMKLDWNRFVAVEKSDAGGARDLASDLRSTLDGPTRLMCLYYLFDGWSPNSAGGTTVLHALLDCFPDSKIVEDCHQALRKATDAKANEQLAGTSVQQVLEQSSVFSQREIHYASIDRQTFLDWWSKTKDTFRPRKEFRPRNDLPEEFSQILAKKTWATHSEPELVKSAGAWEWIRHYATRQLGQGGTRLQAGSFNLASEIEIDT